MISINVNPAASGAGLNLGKANDALQKSLSRLSSGRRIVNSSDDAGGLAVSMKMSAALKRTEATGINLRNIVSYLDTQDGAFKVADKTLSRMSELATLSRDVTKNSGDIENYDKEFANLKSQLTSLATEKFNGVNLFSTDGETFDVPTSEDGSQSSMVTKANIANDNFMHMMINGFNSVDIDGVTYISRSDANVSDVYSTADDGGITIYSLPDGKEFLLRTDDQKSNPTGSSTYNSSTGKWDETHTLNLIVSLPSDPIVQVSSEAVEFTYSVDPTGNPPDTTTAPTPVEVDFDELLENSAELNQSNLDYDNSSNYAYVSQLALQSLGDMRANNGAEMSRINFAQDMIDINAVNLEAANSRIMDVDVAAESSQLARFQILQQAGTAMLAQANTSQQSLVRLLQG
jgi:flagellin-like hook-associated protein FlgL